MSKRKVTFSVISTALFLCGLCVQGLCATLAWDPVEGTGIGYRVYYGTNLGIYPNKPVDVGAATQYDLDKLSLEEGVTYYLAVTAYNTAGESGYSDPIAYTPSDKTPPVPPEGLSVQ